MRLPTHRFRFTTLSLLLAAGPAVVAEPVSNLQVHQAVRTWLQRTPSPLKTPLAADIATIETHRNARGQALFHEVRLAPEGFVIVAPDDLLEPIIAFSARGTLEKDPHNPLYQLLQRDLRTRLAEKALSGSRKLARPLEASPNHPQARWASLMGTGDSPSMAVASVNDERVAPLVQSKWNQSTVSGYNVYNYFTPNHYVCGCVATAMAQLMRFHQFPTASIGAHAFTVYVDGASRQQTTRGGDGVGGAYDWSQMPLVPNATSTDVQRQMIGALTFDAGTAVNMNYASDGSGAYMTTATAALRTTFKYSNAIFGSNGGELTGNGLAEMVQPNLDAGFPVLFGISGDGGHAIVCDGYGYTSGVTYHHLNLGWGGNSDAWYNLPNIGTFANFNVVDECVYNVFPTGTGEILSGRITDGAGSPVAGVAVTDGTVNATTNAKGIYALKGLTAGTKTITATKTGVQFPQAVRLVGASSNGPSVGNVWGVDLVQGSGATPTILPQPLGQEVKFGGSASFVAGATGIGPLSFSWTKNGSPVGNELTYTLASAQEADDQAPIVFHVTGAQGSADSAPAILNVVRLFNGHFEKGNLGWSLYNPGVVLGPGDYDEVLPHGGNLWLCIGDWSASCTDYAVQDIAIPAASEANLSFWVGIANKASAPANPGNIFRVQVLDTSNHLLATLKTLDNTNAQVDTSGKVVWKSYGPYDLKAYANQTIRLRIESYQPGGTNTGTIFAVDDVALAITRTTPTATINRTTYTTVPGDTVAYNATVANYASNSNVNWTSNNGGGSFSATTTASGVSTNFTAGATPGSFTITATPAETPNTPGTSSLTLVAPSNVEVAVTPSTPVALTGASVTLGSSVSLLTNKGVDWTISGGYFSAQSGVSATWASNIVGVYTLTATSQVAAGRSGSTTVRVIDPATIALAVDPVNSKTLLTSGTFTFTATGDQGGGVNWSVSGGATINATSGVLTLPTVSPLTGGTFTVTATSKLDPSKTATATFTLKSMDLDHSGAVDAKDLLVMAQEWGLGTDSASNLLGVGTVDNTDLAALLTKL